MTPERERLIRRTWKVARSAALPPFIAGRAHEWKVVTSLDKPYRAPSARQPRTYRTEILTYTLEINDPARDGEPMARVTCEGIVVEGPWPG